MTQNKTLRLTLAASMVGGMALLAGCSSPPPPQTTSTTTEETTTSQTPAPAMQPAPMAMPGAPGTVTTQTTHSQSSD